MRSNLPIVSTDQPRTPPAERSSGFKVVLVYQDFEMGIRGKQFFNLIAKEAGMEREAQLTVWRFDFIWSESMAAELSLLAAEADVIIVAIRDLHCVPPQVRHWLERWTQGRKVPNGALVAVFDPEQGRHAKSSKVALLLRQAAQQSGMEFFCCVGDENAKNDGLTAITRTASSTASSFIHTLRPHPRG